MSVRTKKHSDERSLFHLRRAAELGDKWAQNNLGVRLAAGNGVAQDHTEAVRWFRASAMAGFPFGAANLGWAYYSEVGGGVVRQRGGRGPRRIRVQLGLTVPGRSWRSL